MAQYTKKAIIATFLELLTTRSLDSITVKDIVDRCEINRNTFYYYFRDIYDLLEHLFQTESQKVLEIQDTECSFQASLKYAIQVILEYRPAIEHIYFSKGRETIEQYLAVTSGYFVSMYIKNQTNGAALAPSERNLLIEFYGNALRGVILRWIREKNGMTPDELVDRLTAICETTIPEAIRSLQERT